MVGHYLYKDTPKILYLALTVLSITQAVVEGMESVFSLNNEKRTTLNPKTVQSETIISPHLGKGVNKLIEKSLDRHFEGSDKWHFITKYYKILFHKL